MHQNGVRFPQQTYECSENSEWKIIFSENKAIRNWASKPPARHADSRTDMHFDATDRFWCSPTASSSQGEVRWRHGKALPGSKTVCLKSRGLCCASIFRQRWFITILAWQADIISSLCRYWLPGFRNNSLGVFIMKWAVKYWLLSLADCHRASRAWQLAGDYCTVCRKAQPWLNLKKRQFDLYS